MAYGDDPSNTCILKDNIPLIETLLYNPQPPNLSDVNNRWLPEFAERWRSNNPPTNVGQYVGDDGVTYLTCSYYNFDPQFELTWATTTLKMLGSDQNLFSVTLLSSCHTDCSISRSVTARCGTGCRPIGACTRQR